ncbi:MAG: septum formation initiator family protein [Clostridia bacterium]|nr:septum formation initiator family protein [Clostridia bacterium]MBR4728569.1 septum formation initiator family protein [Clostridia bacterium]
MQLLKKRFDRMNQQERRFSFITLAVVLLVVCVFVVTILSLTAQAQEKKREIASLNATLAAQQAENQRVQDLIDQGDESEYIERIAREKYGYARPEERVYIDSDQS